MVQINLVFNLPSEGVWVIYGFTRRYHGRRPSILTDTKFIRSVTVIIFMPTPIAACVINALKLSNCLNQLAHIDVTKLSTVRIRKYNDGPIKVEG